MTQPYGSVLTVRPEILDQKPLIDVVDLAAVSQKKNQNKSRGLGAQVPTQDTLTNPSSFFELTFPTEDIQQSLYALSRRAQDPSSVSGTILISGRYGLGKSHVMLTLHHALSEPEAAQRWAAQWRLEPLLLPQRARVVTRNFIHRTAENLWEVFFEAVGQPERSKDVANYPDGDTIQSLLTETPLFLIFDELERWYDAVSDEMKSRNRNFLQALSEVALRDGRLTLITSVLGELQEPAETLRRVKPIELSFRSAQDRERIILFRLFSDRLSLDDDRLDRALSGYYEAYRQAHVDGADAYLQRTRETYPFSPEFIDILTKKVPLVGGFQNVRGTLRFLTRVVQHTHATHDLVSSKDIPVSDPVIEQALRNLDAEIVRRALGDNYEAIPNGLCHKDHLFSVIVFYSIADPTRPGASESDIMRAVMTPSSNPNLIRDSLNRIQELAYNLHIQDDRFLFKTQENPRARINVVARSPQVDDATCRQIVVDALIARWGRPTQTATFRGELEQTRRDLRKINARPRFLISTRSLTPRERLALQNLHERRNLILLIEPRVRSDKHDDTYNLLADDDALRLARRIEACNILLEGHPDASSAKIYRETSRQEETALATLISERYGRYVDWSRSGSSQSEVDDTWYELGTIDDFSAHQFLLSFKQNYSSQVFINARVQDLWGQYQHRKVQQLIDHFETTPHEPVPYDDDMVAIALRRLVRSHVLSLQSPRGQSYHQDNIDTLPADEIAACTVIDAITSPAPPPPPPTHTTHTQVTAHFDPTSSNVKLVWSYPPR